MRSEPKVVRREPFPETKEALVPDDSEEDVGGASILRLSIDDSHVLNSRLGDVYRHRSDCRD